MMNKADEEFMNKVINVIQENISDENFNVERMADILCMSRSSLLRKIKILFNLSPIDFIRLIRLKKAAELYPSSFLPDKRVQKSAGWTLQVSFLHH